MNAVDHYDRYLETLSLNELTFLADNITAIPKDPRRVADAQLFTSTLRHLARLRLEQRLFAVLVSQEEDD